jgi:hypothetical protein
MVALSNKGGYTLWGMGVIYEERKYGSIMFSFGLLENEL